jgi:poly(hydroxyalkanoate) depolymerase family esterase
MMLRTLGHRTKKLCARAWARLTARFARPSQTDTAPPIAATPPSLRAQPAPMLRAEAPAALPAAQADIQTDAPPSHAAAHEDAHALLKPARWLTGLTKNEAGRMMPWVFVPPERKYRLYVPHSAALAQRRAMVVMLHGCRQDAESFARGTRFNQLADQHGFVVLYPDQLDLANPQRCWNWFEQRTLAGQGEAAILFSMIEHAARRAQADPERVVIAGMSSGAALAALLAYQQPARFAGLIVHSGLPPHAADSVSAALEAMQHGAKLDLAELTQRYWAAHQLPPPPLCIIHGDADATVHPANAHALFDLWASLHQAETPAPLVREQHTASALNARTYQVTTLRADQNLVAEKIIVHGLAHAWSGGDAALPFNDASEPSASAMIAQWVRQVAAFESDVSR